MARKYEISKVWQFEAAHCLDHLPPEHPCSHLHGHSYKVRVTFGADILTEAGFVLDYRDISVMNKSLHGILDHTNLNESLGPEIQATTAECIVEFLWTKYSEMLNAKFPEDMGVSLVSVELWETENNHVIYRGGM